MDSPDHGLTNERTDLLDGLTQSLPVLLDLALLYHCSSYLYPCSLLFGVVCLCLWQRFPVLLLVDYIQRIHHLCLYRLPFIASYLGPVRSLDRHLRLARGSIARYQGPQGWFDIIQGRVSVPDPSRCRVASPRLTKSLKYSSACYRMITTNFFSKIQYSQIYRLGITTLITGCAKLSVIASWKENYS